MPYHDTLLFAIFIIFTGAAIVSTIALYTRQSLLVAYIFIGALLGPFGFKLIINPSIINETGNIGILFLLFLLGLNLRPQDLFRMAQKATLITLLSSLFFFAIGYAIAFIFKYSLVECSLIGIAMMFSSTIISIKLLPTTVLHHQHTGKVMVSILLLQDFVAIIVLLLLHETTVGDIAFHRYGLMAITLPYLFLFAFGMERFILSKLIAKFDQVQEYIFLIAIAWCLSMAEIANLTGLSSSIGAFIGGVALASNPISKHITETLKPVRDFFLVLFFFAIGANFNFYLLTTLIIPAALLATAMLIAKPLVFNLLLKQSGEVDNVRFEVGMRLGQLSEFSLLIAYLAINAHLISESASTLIQATTLITFIFSSYLVVLKYPTPESHFYKQTQT